MVALFHPDHLLSRSRHALSGAPASSGGRVARSAPSTAPSLAELAPSPRGLRLVVDNTVDTPDGGAWPPAARGRSAVSAVDQPSLVPVVLAAAVVVFGLLLVIRGVQGGPTDDLSLSTPAVAVAPVGPGDQVIVARQGDTLWSIARSIAPTADPRPIVAGLIEANGGPSLQVGQQIVIPEELLD